MKFRRGAPGLLIAASVLVVLAITGVAQFLTSRLLESAHDGDYQLMRQVLSDFLKDAEQQALTRAELVATMPAVRAAFVGRDRPKLTAECQKMYETQAEKYGLDQAQFHTPPGVSFLRLHAPAQFGDEQASYRPMLAEVHQTKSVRKGTDVTKTGPAVFGIVPIADDAGNFAGSFEMGLDLAPELDTIKEAYGLEAALYFEEKLLRDVATDLPGDVITPKNRVGRYVRFHATHPELAAALVTDGDVDVTEPKSFERSVAGTAWGVQLVPLYNYANHQIGVVALGTNFGADKTLARRALVWQVLAALFGVVTLAGVILVVIRGVLLAPLAALNERMAALAAGDPSRPADPLDSYCEELRTLAANYERLRSRGGP
jgi:methyl-accepting chemotaxis protein